MGLSIKPPIIDFYRIMRRNGGIDLRCMPNLAPWFIKLTLLEPLRLAEHLINDKKIESHELIHPPIFILGFYRNGTTLLQRILALDHGLGYQNIFHSALPEIMLTSENWLKPVLNTISRMFRSENAMHHIPFDWDFPGEEDVALTSLGIAESVNWGNLYPKAYDEYFNKYSWSSADADSSKLWLKNYIYWVKKLSLRHEGKRLVLRSPPNTSRLKLLYEAFPNAKFICIFRDPCQVFASSKRFWKIILRHYAFQTIPDQEVERIIFKSYDETMKLYYHYKASLPGLSIYELTYEGLMKDPVGMLKKLYQELSLGEFEQIYPRLTSFLESAGYYKAMAYEQTIQEKDMIRHKWAMHFSYWQKIGELE
jgi:hypothetical protein